MRTKICLLLTALLLLFSACASKEAVESVQGLESPAPSLESAGLEASRQDAEADEASEEQEEAKPLRTVDWDNFPCADFETNEDAFYESFLVNRTYVLAEHTFPQGIGANRKPATLFLEMTGGVYCAEGIRWNFAWHGSCRFRVCVEGEEDVISQAYVLGFREAFDLQVTDYNADGLPDFAISQWGAASAGDYCAIFTVWENGAVELLPVRGDLRSASPFGLVNINEYDEEAPGVSFFYPHYHGASPALEVLNHLPGFGVTHSANGNVETIFLEDALNALDEYGEWWRTMHGVYPVSYFGKIRDIYQWEGDQFRLVRQELLYDQE